MAHELDTNTATGKAAMFSVRETPWHGEGEILSDAPRSVDEALEKAGLDWEVELRPAHVEVNDGDFVEVPGAKIVTRTDRLAPLGVVGDSYQPLQNRDALRILAPLVDQGVASFETAGSLRGGRDVWALVRFNIDSPVVREVFADEVVPFGLITNNHSGQRKVTLAETPIRVVCANTLGFALRDLKGKGADEVQRIRHSINVEARTIDAARALWGGIIERYEAIATQYRMLKQTYLDEALFRSLVLDVVAPLPTAGNDSDLAQKLLRTRTEKAEARRAKLTNLWTNGTGHSGDGSAWEAYNAVTEATDHDLGVWEVKGSRVQSLLEGRMGDVKAVALASLVEYAEAAAK